MYAAMSNSAISVKALIVAGADVNIKDTMVGACMDAMPCPVDAFMLGDLSN